MKAVPRFLVTIAALVVAAVLVAAIGQLFAGQVIAQTQASPTEAVEATVIAPKNCSIKCTLTNDKYSFYASERCLNSLSRKEIEEFNHKCVVKLEGENKRQQQRYTPSSTFSEAVRSALFADINKDNADKAAPRLAFNTEEEARAWLHAMSPRLQKFIEDRLTREDFLVTAYYEAKRAGMDPQLILGLIQVVSGFQKNKLSKHNARGYMQVNARWIQLIGVDSHNLYHLRTNLRYGCTILRNFLDVNSGDLYKALTAYGADIDPSFGLSSSEFPTQVVRAWQANWTYP